MTILIEAIAAYAPWLYGLVALLALREVNAALRSSRNRRDSVFGLEREAATGGLVRALVMMLLLVVIALGIFAVDNVLEPALPERLDQAPGAEPFIAPTIVAPLPPPTATPTSAATQTASPSRIVTATPSG